MRGHPSAGSGPADFFDRHLLGAPAVLASPVLLAKAEAIGDLLADFY